MTVPSNPSLEDRYAAFLSRWGSYVEDGYGETPSLSDYADALASITASDPIEIYRGMAVHPDWALTLGSGSCLGSTWTLYHATARTYAGAPGGGAHREDGHVAVLLTGIVALECVDLDETVANILVAGEGEVTLTDDAIITLVAVEGPEAPPDVLGREYPAIGERAGLGFP